ncbi:MAG: hypothetical protein R3D88_02085 [Alphaproteobacteria bacterium]
MALKTKIWLWWGFSQGTMMSLYTGLRRQNPLAGILGYSGALIGAGDLTGQNAPPIHLIHGESIEFELRLSPLTIKQSKN